MLSTELILVSEWLTTKEVVICGCPKVKIKSSYPLEDVKVYVNKIGNLLTTLESVSGGRNKQRLKKMNEQQGSLVLHFTTQQSSLIKDKVWVYAYMEVVKIKLEILCKIQEKPNMPQINI